LNILFLSCKSSLLDCSLLHKAHLLLCPYCHYNWFLNRTVGTLHWYPVSLPVFVIRSTESDHAAEKTELEEKGCHYNWSMSWASSQV
jgi:hypothetical protein